MTSQTWLNPKLVSQSVWFHYMVITVPDVIDTEDFATLYIGSGHNGDEPPTEKDEEVKMTLELALYTKLITATLKQIPNQPITFSEDPIKKRRTEDAMIAYTWKHFVLNSSEPEYLARLPMTKAVVRALDTIVEVVRKYKGLTISRFGVAGASKRGWTTWTAALVDTRIIAITPLVLDVINLKPILHHMYRAYDGWTFAFKDYFEVGVTTELDSAVFDELLAIVDPYSYIDRYKRDNISILLINTCGDEFMMPDDNLYFWDKLPGPKYLKMLPNAEHSMVGHLLGTMMDVGSFMLSVVNNYKLPEVSWRFDNKNNLARVYFTSDVQPIRVRFWHATTLQDNIKRDFRLLAGPDPNSPTPQLIFWKEGKVTGTQGNNSYTYMGEINQPTVGWSGCFIEASYGLQIKERIDLFQVTSQVNIVPDKFPFPDCSGQGCKGKLV
ncbi:hypothetical protein LOD99_9336 [Oopsacas minuta]|uniref:Uncharacterized protein n=1 Tax=Oopsacas minuta TaxID=111878 RepID=A0AAV7JBW7_9METZ|nr:hypothetical protein LOD99_9336 [Oopsacas minuta]